MSARSSATPTSSAPPERLTAERHLRAIASRERPAGSDGERAARSYCADVLQAHGFAVTEEHFTYSTIPGRWATPTAGVVSVLLLAAAGHLGYHGEAHAALLLLAAGAVIVGVGAWWLARRGITRLPFGRASSVNLVAARGEPDVWLVAHLDSKSQPVPIGVRALGVIFSILAWLAALGAASLQSRGAIGGALWPWITVVGIIAGAPVMASVVGARSCGALDDASGVATVLATATAHPGAVGVLLTSAEELGLAGARAWASLHRGGRAINVDGVDDAGNIRLTFTRRRPDALIASIERAARSEGLRCGASRLVPGVLVDGVALADAGWSVVTVSRGGWRTVARIHTPSDDLSHLSGSGCAEVARVLARSIAGEG